MFRSKFQILFLFLGILAMGAKARGYELSGLKIASTSQLLLPGKMALTHQCIMLLKATGKVCGFVTDLALQDLDVEVDFGSDTKTLLIFAADTKKILKDPRFENYINELNHRFSAYRMGLSSFPNLVEISKEILGNETESLYWIGVLFQDNNYSYHRNWLVRGSGLNQDLLQKYLLIYSSLSQETIGQQKKNIYPSFLNQEVRAAFGDKIYYYYLNFVLAKKLMTSISRAKVRENILPEVQRVARIFPLFLTQIYLQHHLHHSSIEGLLREVQPLGTTGPDGRLYSNGILESKGHELSQWRARYRDLYMAYIAVLPISEKPLPFSLFERYFFTNPASSMYWLSFHI